MSLRAALGGCLLICADALVAAADVIVPGGESFERHLPVASAAYEAGKAVGVAQERVNRLLADDPDDRAAIQAALDQMHAASADLDRATRGAPA